jgi:hypothetical protein
MHDVYLFHGSRANNSGKEEQDLLTDICLPHHILIMRVPKF